ncbi:hypothetical protein [Caulobacter segnis]|jgi:hypothetical protein|nr:hypothetical protein [Caulobacter segnis]UAL10350.1 hypothetical protein K8940_21720 [Caulobacter segnis]
MAYVSYDRTSAVHATTTPQRKLAWGRLLALAATISLWTGIIAVARVIL